MENKTLSELIAETNKKLVEVLNNSRLAPEILELMLNNIVLSIHKGPATPLDIEEEKDG